MDPGNRRVPDWRGQEGSWALKDGKNKKQKKKKRKKEIDEEESFAASSQRHHYKLQLEMH